MNKVSRILGSTALATGLIFGGSAGAAVAGDDYKDRDKSSHSRHDNDKRDNNRHHDKDWRDNNRHHHDKDWRDNNRHHHAKNGWHWDHKNGWHQHDRNGYFRDRYGNVHVIIIFANH